MPLYIIPMKDGGEMFLCGKLGPHCADSGCADVAANLCDYPVSDGRTCDMPLCRSHSFEAAPNVHYCPGHTVLWREFRESGGVKRELENVVPYSSSSGAEQP